MSLAWKSRIRTGILGSGDLITNQLPTGEVDQGDEPENVDLTSQIQESGVDELGLEKPDQDTSATGFDSEPESDSDPNTLTEEAEGSLAAVGTGESMPILT